MKIIYQIGRLDTIMKPLKFKFERKIYEKELSSFAFKEHFKNGSEVILVYPVSLPINENLIQEKSNLEASFKNEISNILKNKENYLKDPYEFFKKHPHTPQADGFILIHSIGKYDCLKFECSYNDIVLEILFDMIERYNEKKFDEIYVDISSGLNIYISALIEAVRHFSVFEKLQNWQERGTKIYQIFSEPIIGSSANLFEIHKEEVEYKVFFSSPIKNEDLRDYNLSRKIADENKNLKQKIQKHLENFLICFSSIKNSTPLILYTFERNQENEIKELIHEIIKLGKEKLKKDWQKGAGLSKDNFLKSLLALSFYLGIVKVLNKKQIEVDKEKKGIAIEEIKNKFGRKKGSIYEVFGMELNTIFIGNEIRNLEEGKDKDGKTLKDKAENSWILLNKFISAEERQFNPRNFFAHAGFERTVIEIRKENNRLYVRYRESEKERIKKELIEGA